MLAPEPALAALLPAVRTATPVAARATGSGSPGNGAGPEAGAAAPAFALLADPAAAPAADADGKAAKAAVLRGRLAHAREPVPADGAVEAPAALVSIDAALVSVPAPLPCPAVAAPAPRPEVTLAVPSAGIAPSAESGAAPGVKLPVASAPVTPPPAEPEAPAPLPVDGPAPAAAQGVQPAGRGMEAGGAKPALRAEASRPLPQSEAGGAPAPGAISALPAAVGWQPVPPASPAAEAGSAPAPIAPQAVIGQVTVAVARSGGTARKVELRLDPPELGRVEIHLAPTERGALHATVVAERAETHELLRRHGEVLARELGAAGYSDVTLSFSSGGDATGRGSPALVPEPRGAGFVLAPEDDQSLPVAPRSPSPADGALDIRL